MPARPASPNQLFLTVGHLNFSGNIVSVFCGVAIFFSAPPWRAACQKGCQFDICVLLSLPKLNGRECPLCLSEGRGRKTLDSACHFSKRVICYHARSTCRSNWPVEYNVSNFRRYEMTVQCTSLDFCVALIWPCAHPGPF